MALFFRRSSTATSPSVSEDIETLGRLLRLWGADAFDIDQTPAAAFHERCEAWARHVLTGTDAPKGRPQAGRGYADLLQDLGHHRRAERQYVHQTVDGLKGVVWDVVSRLRTATSSTHRDDEVVSSELQRLQKALDNGDAGAIRDAVEQTIRVVSETIEARQCRSAEQLQALGQRLKTLESTLVEAESRHATDSLTGLKNRGALDVDLERFTVMASLSGEPLSVLMIDLDHFKGVNDTHGHPTGDAVLKTVADALYRGFPRKSDYLSRYGGEEFCVVLPGTAQKDAIRLGERFLSQLRDRDIVHDNITLRVTASVGIAQFAPQESPATLIARADKALYAAKRAGRDRVRAASSAG